MFTSPALEYIHRMSFLLIRGVALTIALTECGFAPYDFPDRYYGGHMPQWTAAMKAKFYGVGKPIGKEELDQLTGDFDVVSMVLSRMSL